jgi:hypothetical protein
MRIPLADSASTVVVAARESHKSRLSEGYLDAGSKRGKARCAIFANANSCE